MNPAKSLDDLAVEYDVYGKIINDPRITKLGRFLRRHWIDELPQIPSLMRGDLAPFGIRPMDEQGWEKYPIEIKREALRYKPGLVGINYIIEEGDFNAHLELVARYLYEKRKHPNKTDKLYLKRTLYNIIVKGVRSA